MIVDGTRESATAGPQNGYRAVLQRLQRSALQGPMAPWAFSLAVHSALVVLGFFVVWTVSPPATEDPIPVVVTFDNPAPAPLADDADPAPTEVGGGALLADSLGLPQPQLTVASGIGGSSLPQPGTAPRATQPSDSTSDRRLPEVRFAGLGVSNASSIIYVVDASGSMVSTLPVVLEYLRRSISRLARTQSFQVIFYGREDRQAAPHPGDAAGGVPHWRLIRATPENIAAVLAWAQQIIPGGRSNPIPALRESLHVNPDAVFLLSNVITGVGQWEADADTLLHEIDALNPRDLRTGRRRTVIKTLQFYDKDPAGILRAIGEAHGGEDGYRFIPRTETAP